LARINFRAALLEILNAGPVETKVTYHLIVPMVETKEEVTITTTGIEDLEEWKEETQTTHQETLTIKEEEMGRLDITEIDLIETLIITETLIEEGTTMIQETIQERDRDQMSEGIMTEAREADLDLMNIVVGVGEEDSTIPEEEEETIMLKEIVVIAATWGHKDQ